MPLRPAVIRLAGRLHAAVYRLSGGRLGHMAGGLEQVLLTTRGRRSGARRTVPLMVTPVGDRLVLIASFGGAAEHPAWYLNLVADPRVEVQRGAERFRALATTVTGAERDRLWAAAVAANHGYARYQESTDRQIPVVVLERVAG